MLVLDHAMAVREDGKWCHSDVGLMVSRQNGKGDQDIDSPILTTDGWTTMGEIQAGQEVYGSDGKPVKVIARSEIYTDSECYQVDFTDGSSYVVGGGHLWHVAYKGSRWCDMRTEDLAKTVGGRRADNGRMEYNWRVRCDAHVDSVRADLPIDPYLLGYWLGGGTTGNADITVGHEDLEWTTRRIRETGAIISEPRLKDHGHAWKLPFRITDKGSHSGFRGQLRALGIFDSKRIPEIYLTASIDQRKELLAGLMDSDGYIASTNRAPQVEFTTSIPGLAEDFQRLARSLGIRVTPKIGRSSLNGVRKRDHTRFLWTPAFNPFQMPRKAEKWHAPASNRHELMSITSIKRVETVPTRCIQVDAEDGVYLTGHHFTPTHNSILEAVELWGLFLNEETIMHTAHNHKTSLEHFRRMEALIRSAPELAAEALRFSHNNNDQVIELRNGARLLFGTRTKGAARGLTIDRVICDEAMYLTEEHITALGPTTMAVPNPQTWFTGSAGTKESTEFGRLRARALDGTHPSLFYAEWSIDAHNDFCTFDCEAHDDPNTQESWAQANPALGDRIDIEYISSRSRTMSREAFQQEHLGVGDWPVDGDEWKIISNESWGACADRTSDLVDPLVLAIDTTPDRKYSCISVAGLNQYGQVHVEITNDGESYDRKAGIQWVVPAILDMWKLIKPSCVVIDKRCPAATFIDELTDAGVKVVSPTAAEYAQACGDFYSSVVPRKGEAITLAHIGQPPLNQALAGADKRDLAETWAWSRKTSAVDISPLVAATLAVWGYRKHGHIKTAAPWVAFGGRVVS